jgi:hypothetical protein
VYGLFTESETGASLLKEVTVELFPALDLLELPFLEQPEKKIRDEMRSNLIHDASLFWNIFLKNTLLITPLPYRQSLDRL